MTAAEIADELVLVNAAITTLLTTQAQRVAVDGRDTTLLRLKELKDHRTELERQAAVAAAGGTIRPVGVRYVRSPGGFQ